MSWLWTGAAAVVEGLEEADPKYLKAKENLKDVLIVSEIALVAETIMAVAVVIFGITVIASGAPIVGFALIAVSLPIGFFCVNSYQVSKNLNYIIDHLTEYRGYNLVGNKKAIKTKLAEGTIGFDWAIDLLTAQITKNGLL